MRVPSAAPLGTCCVRSAVVGAAPIKSEHKFVYFSFELVREEEEMPIFPLSEVFFSSMLVVVYDF